MLNITGSTSDLTHQVLSSCGAATALVCSDPNTSTVSALTPGQTYFIRVATWTSTTGQTSSFSVCVKTLPPPPANDECAGAIPLTVGASCSFAQYTNAGATGSVGPPAPGCSLYSGGDVWFSAVVPATGQLIIDTNTGSVTDGGMAIYSGNCGALTLIECDDDDSSNGFMPFIDKTALTPGSTIYIRFWEYGNDNNGTFNICVWAPAPPCNAPGTPSASNVSTTSATVSWGAAMGATSYRYSYGTAGHVCGTGSLTTASTSVNLSGLSPNTTYTFCVRTEACGGGASSSYVSSTFTTAPLPNDNCAGAQTITCGSTINGSTVGASSDAALGSCGIGTGGTPTNGVWYKLVGNGAQVTASLCGSAYDTKLHVYTGTCAGLTCLVSNDDNNACGSGSTRSQVIFNANVGTDYYILVNGFSNSTGAFSLSLTCLCGPALGAPWTVTNIGASNGGAIENVCDGTIDVKATNYGSPTNDVQTYAWQQLCGNGFIKAKLNNVTNGGWGGIMFRENNAGGSKKIALRSQLTSTVVRDLRASTNGAAQQQQFPRPNTPQWLRLTRTGNVFLGETSVDGVNWDFTFSTTMILPSCIEVGLFAQSINVNTTTTAVFSNIMGVALTPPVIPLVQGNNDTEVESIGFSLFPNPAKDEVNIKLPSYIGKQVQIVVYNNVGQAVIVRDIDEVQDAIERLPLTELANGVYFVTVRSEGMPMQTQKLIVGSPRP
ncbi:MAG: fibronectin type III domain-containing protein [Saprospiraceae bacterium]|nr:fibronectin type III domain-containing protein [Saprospiraceae bacterium]